MAFRTSTGTYSRFGDFMAPVQDPALEALGLKGKAANADPYSTNRKITATLYQQGIDAQKKAYYQQRQDITAGSKAAVATIKAGLGSFQDFADSLASGVDATLEGYMLEVDQDVKDVDEARLRALGYVDASLPEILGEYERMYSGSMDQLAEFKKQADPQKLMSLGFSQVEGEFDKFRQDTARQLQAGGYSPKVLREAGQTQLATLLSEGGKYAAQMTEQAMGMQRQAAQMGIDIESQRGLAAAGSRETATGRKVAIETDMARLGTGYQMEGARYGLAHATDIQGLRLQALQSGQAARGQMAQYQYQSGQDLAKLQPDYMGAGLQAASLFSTKIQQGVSANTKNYYYSAGKQEEIKT